MQKTLFLALLLLLASGAALLASGAPAPAAPLQPALQVAPVQPIPAPALSPLPAFLVAPSSTAAPAAIPADLPGETGIICPILPRCSSYCTYHGCVVCC